MNKTMLRKDSLTGEGKSICVGRLVPSSGSVFDYAHRVYSSRGCSPCIITRVADVTLCPKFLIEYD